ncbi:hypothetical protein Mgra_00007678, partial [Meloidogyne graminicola]
VASKEKTTRFGEGNAGIRLVLIKKKEELNI